MKSIKNIFIPIVYIYFIGWGFAVPYYNYQYANNNGFLKWVFFGEVIATFEAFGWPYDAYQHNIGKRTNELSSELEKELTYFQFSIESRNKANEFLSGRTNKSKAGDMILEKDIELIRLHLREALDASALVSSKSLIKLHKDLPTMYETKFREGLKLTIEGFKENGEGTAEDLMLGQKMLNDFGDWYVENLRK